METINFFTDAKLNLMRDCVQCPGTPYFDEEIDTFRALTQEVLGKKIKLINCKFIEK